MKPGLTANDSQPFYLKSSFHAWLLAGLALVCYFNILNNALFLDDLDFITTNAYIRDWRYFPKLFTEHMTAGAGKTSDYYRPMMQFMFLLGYSAWELNPMGYHLLSILFHVANALLLYRFLGSLLKNRTLALAVSALFTVHPGQTESVASASALGILLGMFFAMTALLSFLRKDSLRFRILSYAAAALSVLSKETMVVLPGLVFLSQFYFLEYSPSVRERFKNSLRAAAPYLAIAVFYVALRFTVLNFGGTGNLFRTENVFTNSWTARFFTFSVVLVELLKIILWPTTLFMERSTTIPIYVSFGNLPVAAGLSTFFGMMGAASYWTWKAVKNRSISPVLPFGTFWFLFGLVPVSNVFIPISTTIVESWLYMTQLGIILVVLHILLRAFPPGDTVTEKFPLPLVITLCAIAIVFARKTVLQNRVWKTPISFYEHNLKHAPESARFRNNLAMAYADEKRFAEAIPEYQMAIQINDQYPETHHNLANVYEAIGQAQNAEKEYHRAIEMNPQFFFSYTALASLYLKANRSDLAESVLQSLIQNAPNRWEGYYNLGVIYSIKGDQEKARQLWREGLQVDPYNKNLSVALEKG